MNHGDAPNGANRKRDRPQAGTVVKSFLVPSIALAVLVLAPAISAHPGRVGKDGCHTPLKNYRLKDGRVVKKGERHCHRNLGEGIRLDGRQVLEQPGATHERLPRLRVK